MNRLEQADPEVARIIQAEQRRQADTLEMIASENHVSPPVLVALGSVLTDKYAEGYPGGRYYCGNQNIDNVERLAIKRAKELFGAEHANVQPHCGTSANLAVYLAALHPGEKILGMELAHGGHLSHGMKINISGKFYKTFGYGLDPDTERINMDDVRRRALELRPDILVAGASAYPRTIDFEAFGKIAEEVDCPLLADIAHIAGLVVAHVHPSPVPYSTFVTTTNHKTLRGPRGGIILCRKEWAERIDAAVFPGLQGGPLEHVIAAKAVAFHEAMKPEFRIYAAAIVANAKALAEELTAAGWRLVSGGTDNHLLLVDLRSRDGDLDGQTASDQLARAGIITNKNVIPFDTRKPAQTSGIRLGTPALTTRGMGTGEMKTIAGWIDEILTSGGDKALLRSIRRKVLEMCRQFPIPNDLTV
ncbi:MAG: serine hydroxymethyltransferase [Phycisphaerae bacterium]